MNTRLKAAIYAAGTNQQRLAKDAGISEVALSRIVTSRKQPTEDEQNRLSRLLQTTKSDLFGEVGGRSRAEK